MEIEIKTIDKDLEFLRQKSEEIDLSTDDIKSYIELSRKYCNEKKLYAIAPVQIGIPKRMIYIRNSNEDMTKNEVLLNPKIISAKGLTSFLEGCGSCLDKRALVDRPYQIEVEYMDLSGNTKTEIFEGFISTILCHEYDHLNGILHIDRSDKVFEMTREETKKYRDEHPYKVISKTCEYDSTSVVKKRIL